MLTYLPIIVGFAIGLVTNFIAILMMFRPHERKGWLFLWPQGLVPRERSALAHSVGEAVGGELLGPAQIEELVSGPAGRERTKQLLDRLIETTTASLAEKPLSELLGALSWEEWAERIRSFLNEETRRQSLRTWLVELIHDRIVVLAHQSVEEVMGAENCNEVEQLMAQRLRKSTLAQKTNTFVKKSRYFFTPSLLVEWLYGEENRSAVERAADDLARLILTSLRERKVDSLLGFDADQESRRIAIEAADKILQHFSSAENMQHFIADLRQQLTPFLEETPLVLSERVDPHLIASLREHLEELVHNLLRENAAAVVKALDVAGVVEERVGAYPVADLERLVLDISGRHLKWITLWGGILGAMLGALQLVLPH